MNLTKLDYSHTLYFHCTIMKRNIETIPEDYEYITPLFSDSLVVPKECY
jgi:hypothetical protein